MLQAGRDASTVTYEQRRRSAPLTDMLVTAEMIAGSVRPHADPMPGCAKIAFEVPHVLRPRRLSLPGGIPGPHSQFMLPRRQVERYLPERPAPGRGWITFQLGLVPGSAAIGRDPDTHDSAVSRNSVAFQRHTARLQVRLRCGIAD